MPLTIRRYITLTLMLVALSLVACGGQSTPRSAGGSAAPGTAATPRASSAATATVSAAPSPSAASNAPSPAVASAPTGTGRYAGIAQSKTAEGYYMLGEPDAPVVLTHYSDFL